jgi:hypothetical protein
MGTEREQKLVDLCFSIALMLSTPGNDRSGEPYDMTVMTTERKAEWIAHQLRECGFDTEPMGISWGVLK